ncbi:MAG: ACT domain-containing protein [Candidatus Heimdallarchaeota archaeon]|nr:ACT domain-containing protein [Candidatus Heimdallarchaeota archaeon]
MRVVDIVRVDNRGRITLTTSLRETLGIAEGMHVMLIGDLEKREIRIIPFADPEAELYEIKITLTDKPGSLAKAASILAENRIDLLSSQSQTLRRGQSAEWFVVVDISKSLTELETIKERIIKAGAALAVDYKQFL